MEGTINLRTETKNLVAREKHYTALILKNLARIESQKLYSDYGHSSLYRYLTKELKYSDGEANIRVAAVRLVVRNRDVTQKIQSGKLSLTNAAQAHNFLCQYEKESSQKANKKTVEHAVKLSEDESTRSAKDKLRRALKLSTPRTEKILLDEKILVKVDRARKIYGNISAYELLDILLEEKLKAPAKPLRKRSVAAKVSRYIPVKVKYCVYKGVCLKCGSKRNLEYDHKKSFSRGGDNSAGNIQVLCGSCNKRKYLKEKNAHF